MCPFEDDDDLLSVKPRAIALWHQHQEVVGERDALKARVEELERQIAQHNKARFGRTSERTDKPATPPPATGEKPKREGHGRREQPYLEKDEKVHEVPAAERTCTSCGGTLELWEGETEDSTELDVEPRRFVQRTHKRLKYRCRCGGCVLTAPGPLKLQEGGSYSIRFGVEVAADKYDQHLPLERQARVMHTQGLRIDTQTLWDQVDAVAFWSIGAYHALKNHVLEHPVVGGDETTWRLMDTRKNAPVTTSKWWIWVARAPRAVVYHFAGHRSADAGGELFEGYEGVVVCDGYLAYQTLQNRNPGLLLAHCWAHLRRDYHELEQGAAGASRGLLALIDELFRIEREVPPGDDTARLQARRQRAVPVLEQIAEGALQVGLSSTPQSRAYVVTQRLAEQWEGLTRFVRDVRIPLSNNETEQSARGPVLGRKNHQGSRSERGTKVSAILYSLVESAKLAGLDPRAYLQLVVVRARRGLSPLLPHQVTRAALREHCGLSEASAKAALGL